MIKIRQNSKSTQDKKNIFARKGRTRGEFKVGEHVFLKVKAKNSSLKLGSYSKLVARYCGSFDILGRINHVAYMLAFPTSM
jgi:hypothetical protein